MSTPIFDALATERRGEVTFEQLLAIAGVLGLDVRRTIQITLDVDGGETVTLADDGRLVTTTLIYTHQED